ncbi:hypothetical protein V9T40_009086 [Parthenolecanium corni]|uniref:Uncharacterized protein n=1 Tax=Parthenolecanium corni TaxID=536013 RepID=A0AAN9TRW1_9HEMI
MFTGLNAFNESDYNLTIPFNSTIGSLDYTNASRHFAEEPFSSYSNYRGNKYLTKNLMQL